MANVTQNGVADGHTDEMMCRLGLAIFFFILNERKKRYNSKHLIASLINYCYLLHIYKDKISSHTKF